MLGYKLHWPPAKDSSAVVLLHCFTLPIPGRFTMWKHLVLKPVVLLLKHPRKPGVMVLQSGIVCFSDVLHGKLVISNALWHCPCPLMARDEEEERGRNLRSSIHHPCSEGRLRCGVSHVCRQPFARQL